MSILSQATSTREQVIQAIAHYLTRVSDSELVEAYNTVVDDGVLRTTDGGRFVIADLEEELEERLDDEESLSEKVSPH